MQKLKKIISQLNEDQYSEIEASMKGGESAKNYFLMSSYKDNSLADDEIKNQLKCTDNSYYALKSRLYDKIQKYLTDNETGSSKSISDSGGSNLLSYVYEYPLETSIAVLQELETKYKNSDSPNDMMHIYSALKKAHFYTDKYYTYSQLFNNQVAYALALEKAEETLYSFNRTLASFHFSDSDSDKELIALLKKEIKNIYSINKSPRIELIMHIIFIQASLFGGIENPEDPPVEDLLERCNTIIAGFVNDKKTKYYKMVMTFLHFEYYLSVNQIKKAQNYFNELESISNQWLLLNNLCLSFKFLLSRNEFLIKQNQQNLLGDVTKEMHFDSNDIYTTVIYRYNKSLGQYYQGNVRSSITIMNELLNEISFTNFFYIESEIKLALALMYILQDETEMAEGLLKGVSRKLMGLKTEQFKNIKEAVKLLGLKITGFEKVNHKSKFKTSLEQLDFYNTKEKKVMVSLRNELDKLLH